MSEFWERWKLIWDWLGRVAVLCFFLCICLYAFRCYLAGRVLSRQEFGHFMAGLVNYIVA
jgi:hypothetical protein